MMSTKHRVAILYPGDQKVRQEATPENNRFAAIFRALAGIGIDAEPVVYHDDWVADVKSQLLGAQAVLVWVNPIEGGRDRSVLDAMLREIAARGTIVSAHPDVILKMGTKEVLYETRSLEWGCDTQMYRSMDELRRQLPDRLARGEVRVLKQHRGNGGDGVWKIQAQSPGPASSGTVLPVRVRHAKRGSVETLMTMNEFLATCEPYFAGTGRMIDQPFQERLQDGMIRCYLVGNQVAGFGHQQINALYPAPRGMPESAAPQPGPRLYFPPTKPEFQALKERLESRWVSDMQRVLGIATEDLPVLWDADFLLGKRDAAGQDTYVLCEINVSSVAPFPDSAPEPIAALLKKRIAAR